MINNRKPSERFWHRKCDDDDDADQTGCEDKKLLRLSFKKKRMEEIISIAPVSSEKLSSLN